MSTTSQQQRRQSATARWVAALDVGGMSVKFGAASDAGDVTGVSQVPLNNRGTAEQLLGILADAASNAIAAAPAGPVGISVAFPAPFDYESATPRLRHKFGSIFGLDLAHELRARLGTTLAISFCNDAAAAGIGEAAFGNARTNQRVVMITLGTGLGACAVEAGHVVQTPAALAIPELYREHFRTETADDVFSARGLASALGCDVGDLKTRVDQARIDGRDNAAFDQFGRDLGTFLSPYLQAAGAELLIIGGGAGGALDLFADSLGTESGCAVAAASLGSKAALLGAVVSALD